MSDAYNIYAGHRDPQVPGATLAETLWADLEAAFGIQFNGDACGKSPSFTWRESERWLSVWVAVPPDRDEPDHSHPARVTAHQPDSGAWAQRVFDALDATGRYSLFMIEDDHALVRTNSESARTQWDDPGRSPGPHPRGRPLTPCPAGEPERMRRGAPGYRAAS
ncbi:hypothetical protein ACWGET_06495 [Streptomyces zaomyceticus]|uniref:hypothetical protein n=1 Tax=Streptomyces zaomyceticus TaxID=68286 RepID=UPI002E1B6226